MVVCGPRSESEAAGIWTAMESREFQGNGISSFSFRICPVSIDPPPHPLPLSLQSLDAVQQFVAFARKWKKLKGCCFEDAAAGWNCLIASSFERRNIASTEQWAHMRRITPCCT